MDREGLLRATQPYREVWVDIGTGNGVFVYDAARRNPDVFVLGLDPNRENLRHYSAKIRKKATRGGLANAMYAIGTIENPPPECHGLAARVYVNFPWGSLLRGLFVPDPAIVRNLRSFGTPDASYTILANQTVFEDPALVHTLELPPVTPEYVRNVLAPVYAAAGLAIEEARVLAPDEIPYRTEWGQKLTVSGTRDTLLVLARAIPRT